MKSPVFAASLIFLSSAAFAQLPQIDVAGTNGPTAFRMNDPTGLTTKTPDVSYREVDGKYLWKEDWNPALIILKAGTPTKMSQVKLNYYTNEVHFMTKDGEMSAPVSKIKKIEVYSAKAADSTTVLGKFDVIRSGNSDVLYQVMNDGATQLLKRVVVTLKKDGFDPAIAKDKYHFDSETTYYIRTDAGLKPLKALSKSAIFDAVPTAASGEEWLSSNKNKLKKPEDVAEFLTYLNSQAK